jgi:fucose permease
MDIPYARTKLMWASFLTLVASGVGFATRTAAGGVWEREFGLGGGDFGAILGAGFLGFGLMIFFGGILVEKFGYKKLLILAFLLHLVSGAMLFAASPMFVGWREADPATATGKVFNLLFWSAFVFSICQGLYEAVINPLIAQLYPENKTHYLNILHAGWPAGMIIGGLFAAGFIGDECWIVQLPWQYALSFFVVFVLAYGILALPEKFPSTVGESSKEGFSVVFGCFASLPFLVLIVLHALIGYMELGVDSWMAKLMENLLPNAILVLVYTSFLMFFLRFFAGPIVHRINPIGLLLISSVVACLGLLWLSSPIESVAMIFVAATFYSFGKAFLWPTMLGVAGERYPKSGSVAMGALGAAGMLTVGQIAGPRIGTQQGFAMSERLKETASETFERYAETDYVTSWGYEFRPIIGERLNAANSIEIKEDGLLADLGPIENAGLIDDEDKPVLLANAAVDVPAVQEANLYGGRMALYWTALIPAMMAMGFAGLFVYYFMIGGYKPVHLEGTQASSGHKEEHPEEVEATGY